MLLIIGDDIRTTLTKEKIVIVSTDKDPSLRTESFAIIDLRGVSTKLTKYKRKKVQKKSIRKSV